MKTRRSRSTSRASRAVALMVALALAVPLAARVGVGRQPFERSVFKPELVIANQRKIGMTTEQRELFIREMQQTQADLLPTQLEMSAASAELMELLEGPRIDEEAALDAAARVLELERRVKSRHMVLLIRIKNLLTAEQQRTLREIRDAG